MEDDPSVDGDFTAILTQVDIDTEGNGGVLTFDSDNINFQGQDVFISVSTFGSGDSGQLNIFTNQLSVSEGAEVQAITFAGGDGGELTIEASNLVRIDGFFGLSSDSFSSGNEGISGGIFASAITGNGNGGNLTINTERLTVNDLGTINVSNFQTLGVRDPGQGAAGNLTVNANSVEVDNGLITAANANGVGGALTINTDSLNLDNQGSIEAFTTSTIGEGGIINLNLDGDLFLSNNSQISASTQNGADGGIININANSIVAFPDQNNDIIANAFQGNGGDINIITEALLGLEERSSTPDNQTNDIDVSSDFGLDGNISISTPDVGLTDGIVELPTGIVEADQTVAQACRSNIQSGKSSNFTIKGKGGIPPTPESPLISQNVFINGESANSISTIPQPMSTSYGKIQPARGIKVTQDGGIVLTAYRTNNSGDRLPEGSTNCGGV